MFCSKQMLSSCLQGKPSWVSRVVQQPRCICLQHAHTALGHAANAMCCRYGTSLSMPCTEHRHTQSRNPSYNLANPGQGSSPGQVGGVLQEPVMQPLSRCHRTLGPQLYILARQCWSGMTFALALFSFSRTKTLLHVFAVLPTTLPQHHFSWKASKRRESNE